ncbi:DUF389 domain-containing protein [bacterium]|nr:DUF389 domain-containing protein [bacterium]
MTQQKESVVPVSMFEKKQAIEKLIEESVLTHEFYFLLCSSTILITLGLVLNNPAVIIGGMLLAPLLSPLLIIGLGIVVCRKDIIIGNSLDFAKIVGVIVVVSFAISFIFNIREETPEILLRTASNFEYFLIAFVAGVVGTYFWVKPHLQNLISGIVIAVALVPPLCTLGIGMNMLDRDVIAGSIMFFLINFIGVILGSVLMFSLFGFGKVEKGVEKTIKKKLKEVNKLSSNNSKSKRKRP